MTDHPPACVDCRHFIEGPFDPRLPIPIPMKQCLRSAGYYSPVRGWVADAPRLMCNEERRPFSLWERLTKRLGRCGPAAKFWVPRAKVLNVVRHD